MRREDARKALVEALRNLSPAMRKRLQELKREGMRLSQREHLVWDLLVGSFATMGNSRGWKGLYGTPGLLGQVEYRSLERLTPAARRRRIEAVFCKAKVRMPARKADWLAKSFASIAQRGGPEAVTRAALSLSTRQQKYQFMDAFPGIGEKYARNVWMDLYDPSFRHTIAVDERIKAISAALGRSFTTYDQHEQFYQDLAAEAGLLPWELDRLLYNFRDHFLHVIVQAGGARLNEALHRRRQKATSR